MRRCGSRSPRSLVATARLAPTGPPHPLTCRGRGGGAGRSGVASAGPARESRRAPGLGGSSAVGGRQCACARGQGNGRRRGSEKLEEAECLKGAACGSRFLFDSYGHSFSKGWERMCLCGSPVVPGSVAKLMVTARLAWPVPALGSWEPSRCHWWTSTRSGSPELLQPPQLTAGREIPAAASHSSSWTRLPLL